MKNAPKRQFPCRLEPIASSTGMMPQEWTGTSSRASIERGWGNTMAGSGETCQASMDANRQGDDGGWKKGWRYRTKKSTVDAS